VDQLGREEVVRLVLDPSELEGLLRRSDVTRHDPEERVLVAPLARDRPDVHGVFRERFRDPRELSRFVLHKNLELLHVGSPASGRGNPWRDLRLAGARATSTATADSGPAGTGSLRGCSEDSAVSARGGRAR